MTAGRVAVVGAGIAGLVAALSLARAGFEVRVFERSAALDAVGAGVQLSPNALRVLRALGLLPAVMEAGVAADTVTLRAGHGGRVIAKVPVRGSDGTPYLSIHRADLQRVLLDAAELDPRVSIRFASALSGLGSGSSSVVLRFADGAEAQADCVLGADGIHSTVALLTGAAPPVPTGTTAFRAMLRTPPDGEEAAGIQAWLGARRHAVAYPVCGGRETNLVLIESGPVADDIADDGVRPRLSRSFARWDARLLATLDAAGPVTAWPILAVPPDRAWTRAKRVLLIGDAAHAMAPYAAQGAALAIEDGWEAAASLARHQRAEAAFAAFEAARAPRVEAVRRRVAFHRFTYHLPFPVSLARDAVLAARPPQAIGRDLAWLYDWEPSRLETASALR